MYGVFVCVGTYRRCVGVHIYLCEIMCGCGAKQIESQEREEVQGRGLIDMEMIYRNGGSY